jgi:arylsulfatase A-like enzyme
MQSPSNGRSRIRGALAAAVLGGVIGLTAGAIEGAAALYFSPLEFRAPLVELLAVEGAYGLAGAALAAVLALSFRSMTPRLSGAWTLGALCSFVFLAWTKNLLPGADEITSPTSLASLTLAVIVAIALAFAFARFAKRPRPVAAFAAASLVAAHALALSVGGSAPAAVHTAASTPREKAPNVVVILIDTLRADHLSCYGYARPTSPTIDAIAKQGARFDAAYSAAPWTRPSVASLMTSLYPSSHDVYSQWRRLPSEIPTLAELMQKRGYRTAAFSANLQVSPTFGFGRGFDSFWNSGLPSLLGQTAMGGWRKFLRDNLFRPLLARAAPQKQGESWALRGTDAGAVNEAIFDWVDGVKPDEPVFLYVQYLDPHHPYSPPEDLLNDKPLDALTLNNVPSVPVKRVPYPLAKYDEPTPDALAGVTALYDAEIRYCDREVGRLLDRLREKGLLDSSYVIITADHGEELFDHGQWLHGHSLFDELVRVPLIVTGPGVPPQVVATPVSLVDVLPTIAGFANAPVEFPIQGQSLAPLLRATASDAVEHAPSERSIYFERPEEPGLSGLRLGAQKIIRLDAPEKEIWMQFDLASDPHEKHDLSKSDSSSLRAQLIQAQLDAMQLFRNHAAEIALPGSVKASLKALGYIGDDEEHE